MYKQQSPVSVSSAISAILVTIVVLLIAASASAQTTDTVTIEPVPVDNGIQTNVGPPPPQMPMPDSGTTTNPVPGAMLRRTDAAPLPVNAVREATLQNQSEARTNASSSITSGANRMQAWREAIKNRQLAIEQKRVALQNASTSRPAVLRPAVQTNVTVGISSITSTLNNAITNSLSINARLQTKATELQTRGIDVSAATVLLTEADQLLNLAMDALEGISINAQYAVTSDDPLADWSAVRQQFGEVRELIKQAHQVMREASAVIKSSITPTDSN